MIKINGKYIRNIPEQVGKNKYDINALVNLIIDLETKVNNLASGVYKPQGDATVAQLNALTVDSSMNGYVYNVTDSGTLTQGSVNVIAGDNVVIVWKEDLQTFEWDLLSGIVDLSNYYTKSEADAEFVDLDSAQTITGIKTIDNKLNFGKANIVKDSNVFYVEDSSNEATILSADAGECRTRDLKPIGNASNDLGSSSIKWKDAYIAGSIYVGAAGGIYSCYKDGGGVFNFALSGNSLLRVYSTYVAPSVNNTSDLGTSSLAWKDLYLAGTAYINKIEPAGNLTLGKSYNSVLVDSYLQPSRNNTYNLGSNVAKWNDIYMSGKLTDGTNEASITDLAALITYAKAQGWIS